jgi:hypothetical protein
MNSRTSLPGLCALVTSLGVFGVVLGVIATTPRHASLLSKSMRPTELLSSGSSFSSVGGVGVLREPNMIKPASAESRATPSPPLDLKLDELLAFGQ